MNIKKIILEEMDDFQWAKDVMIPFSHDNMPKVGDTVTTLSGFNGDNEFDDDDLTYGGAGYKEDHTFVVDRITNLNHRPVIWSDDYDYGIFVDALTSVNSINESEFDWAKEHDPIPHGLHTISEWADGNYKLWLGDIPKYQQLGIVNYIEEKFKDNAIKTSRSLDKIIRSVSSDDYSINTLFFVVNSLGDIVVSMMGVYSKDYREPKKTARLNECRAYYYNHSAKEV